jgi:Glycosyltransferase
MKIAFDAKRAFHNSRGLGNYSRDTIRLLGASFPENEFFLMNPTSKGNLNFPLSANMKEIRPQTLAGRTFKSIWRSYGMLRQIQSIHPDIYHGLSQELPINIQKTGVKSIVTMHDAIFMRYPELYSSSYRSVFIQKNRYACKTADRIIAISEQTKRDIIRFFDADNAKIDVVYQGCNSLFREPVSLEKQKKVHDKYNLPQHFLLNIGAIEKRKNVSLIIEAMYRSRLDIPLVVIGRPSDYMKDLKAMIQKNQMEKQVIFIHNAENEDLPAIYKSAEIFVYPSIFEGFGIPILEALCSGTPVISSTGSCFEETGGPFSKYINPYDADELGDVLSQILSDKASREYMKKEGLIFADNFTDNQIVQNLMKVYKSVLI